MPYDSSRNAFNYRVDQSTNCWIWQGPAHGKSGYGCLYVRGVGKCLAHRFLYETKNGPIPKGLVIDHLCRNKACVNPDHLEAVTPTENVLRGNVPKLSTEDIKMIRVLGETMSLKKIGHQFGVSCNHIVDIVNGKSRKSG